MKNLNKQHPSLTYLHWTIDARIVFECIYVDQPADALSPSQMEENVQQVVVLCLFILDHPNVH